MIEAVCWDVGGVFTGSPHDAVASVAAEHGLTHEQLSGAVFGDLAGEGDHPWHELERGRLSLREAWPLIEQHIAGLGIEITLRDVFRRVGADPHDRAVVHDTVAAFAELGVAQAVVTNNVREFADMGEGRGWQRLVPMEHMAVVVDSSAVGMRKPDAEIYHHLLAELGVAPEAAVLVDDTPVNLDGAAAIGMHTVHVDLDPAPAMQTLRSLVTGSV
ncbi:MAG: HAD-IA family hydrolase [Actinomycetota bacterium]